MAAENIENCNSCDTAEKLAELPVIVLAKFSEDLLDMAKENWCESHITMLRRLILAVQQGARYDETLLPEEAEQALKKMESEVSDDVCEWKVVNRPHNLPIYNTSCGKIRLQYSTGVDIYCNGCGKQIKVVDNDK